MCLTFPAPLLEAALLAALEAVLICTSAVVPMSAADGWGFSRLGFSDLTENWSFWGSGRPLGALEPFKKGGGLRPPPFWMVFKPPGAAQTPKMTDFQSNH